MKIIITIIATFVLTMVIIIGGGAWYIAKKNPYNIQACVISSFLNQDEGSASLASSTTEASDFDHPLLSNDQEKMLESLGIDIGTLPASISPETKACAVEKLGEKRVQEILDGGAPGAFEIFKVKDCL